MSNEETIETRMITVKDDSGKAHKFNVKVCNSHCHLFDKAALTFHVHYSTLPVLGITFYGVPEKNEFQTDSTSGWTFEMPMEIRNKGVGARLWRELEAMFGEYCVTSIWGNLETIGCTDAEIQMKADFWKRMGFTIVRKYEIHKAYQPRAT